MSKSTKSKESAFLGELGEKRREAIVKFLKGIQTTHGSLDQAMATLTFCASLIKGRHEKGEDFVRYLQEVKSKISHYRQCGL